MPNGMQTKPIPTAHPSFSGVGGTSDAVSQTGNRLIPPNATSVR